MNGRWIFAALVALSLGLFLLLPTADIAVSRLFYDPQHGFPLADSPLLRGLEGAIRWIAWAIAGIVVLGALWLAVTGRPCWRLDRNALIFLVAATAIGPGLIVNVALKDHWGRARPYQTEEFGGARQFTPAPLPAEQCERNCSFVSGHAALGFSLVSFAFLLASGRRRTVAIGAAIAFGALVGLGRIAAGRHFLSDIVDAGLIVFGVSWLLHRWIVDGDAVGRLAATATGRFVLWAGAILAFDAVSIAWIDRPLADYLHADGQALQPFFDVVQRFGIGYPYLVLSAIAFAALRWGGNIPPLRPRGRALRAASRIPAFIFAAVAASGLTVDLIKIIVGRTRPKLLFLQGTYDFGWFGWRADDWSFPSGHAATAAAVMTALWCLWPRPLLLYVAGAALVAASRVVTGAHYLSDVVTGAAIAVAVTRALAQWLAPQRTVAKAERAAVRHYRAV